MADLRPIYVAGDGDVKGPASASNDFLPLFAGTTGKLLKSSGTGVTAQGLAILDDNTPAEQRNTIGLGQVTNTSDINKPVSTAQQAALNLKQDKLGYTPVQQGGGIGQGANKVYIGWDSTAGKLKAAVDSTDLGNVAFNLDSVDNTRDVNKPVSTAQQAALNLKQNADATLTALAALTVAADKLIYATGIDTFATTVLTAFARTLLNDANAAEARATLDVYSKVEAEGIAIGVGQTWQGVTASRASGTTYTNTTGKPIMVSVYSKTFTNGSASLSAYVDELLIQVSRNQTNFTGVETVCFIVPAASTYSITSSGAGIAMWAELR